MHTKWAVDLLSAVSSGRAHHLDHEGEYEAARHALIVDIHEKDLNAQSRVGPLNVDARILRAPVVLYALVLMLAFPAVAQSRVDAAAKISSAAARIDQGASGGAVSAITTGAGSLVNGRCTLSTGATTIGDDAGCTWAGTGTTFNLGLGQGLTFNASSKLIYGGANVLSQTNLANAQTFLLYNTTDNDPAPANYERATFKFVSGIFTLTNEAAGTGVTTRNMDIFTGGSGNLRLGANGSTSWFFSGTGAVGHLAPLNSNSAGSDIGDSTHIIRSFYKSGQVRNTADVTNATTTFANLTDLTVTVVSGQKYIGAMEGVFSDSTAADGLKIDFNGGAATMTSFSSFMVCNAATAPVVGTPNATTLAGVLNYTTITGETLCHIYLSFVPSSTGTFIPRQAQNAHSTGTLTTRLGTYLLLEDSSN